MKLNTTKSSSTISLRQILEFKNWTFIT